jgi:hypothetical protein
MLNLTEKMGNIWKKIKKQPKDIWFFYLFLLTFTLGVRKVILFFPVKRAFNEYVGVYVYASDIFLCSTILVWIIPILYNKISNSSSSKEAISEVIYRKDINKKDEFTVIHKLSTDKLSIIGAIFGVFDRIGFFWKEFIVPRGTFWRASFQKLFHVEHFGEQAFKNCSTPKNPIMFHVEHYRITGQAWNNMGVFLIPILLVFWSFFSVAWSENQLVGFYRSTRFLELYLLFIYVSARFVPYLIQSLQNCSTWNNLDLANNKNVPRGIIVTHESGVKFFCYSLPKVVQYFRAILMGIIVIMLFDHYLWDIWQGQVLFCIVCGFLAGAGFSERNNLKNCSTWNNFKKNANEIVPPSFAKASAGKRGIIIVLAVSFGIIMLLGVAHSLIGIAQFIAQYSLGLFWLKESLIGPDIAGVAKIIINYQPFIRAYGLFPHPNILGGFLFFSIIVTMLYKKLFHSEKSNNVPRGTLLDHGAGVEQFEKQESGNCSTWNNFDRDGQSFNNVPRGTFWSSLKEKVLNMGNFINLILLIQIFGIIVSFSKSAILALVVATIFIIVPRGTFSDEHGKNSCDEFGDEKCKNSSCENCSTPKNSKLFHVEQFRITGQAWNNLGIKIFKMFHLKKSNNVPRGTLLNRGAGVEYFRVGISKFALSVGFLLLAFVGLTYFKFNFQAFFLKSLEERNLYLSVSERIISENPIVGIGTGQFIFETERLLPNLEISQYQPVHNVFLIIWSEWGIVGLVLFILFLWKLFHVEQFDLKSSSPFGRGCPKDR